MVAQITSPCKMQTTFSSAASLPRVLVIGYEDLLEHCAIQLLSIHQNREVFHLYPHDFYNLTLNIKQLRPKIVVLCHLKSDIESRLLEYLKSQTDTRILLVPMVNTDLFAWQENGWVSADLADFIPLVNGENVGNAIATYQA